MEGMKRAVGATLASLILFSSIIIMNAMIISFREDELSLLVISNELRSIRLEALISEQAVAIEALNRIMHLLSTTSIRCSNAIQTVAKITDLRLTYNSTILHTSISTSLSSYTNAHDNLSSISPFNGNKYDAINLIASIKQYGSTNDGMVSYEKSEVHYLNIPANLYGATSLCLSVKRGLITHLNSLRNNTCSQELLDTIKRDIYNGYESQALDKGISLQLTLSQIDFDCSNIHYSIFVYQVVSGINGSFRLTLYDDGSILI